MKRKKIYILLATFSECVLLLHILLFYLGEKWKSLPQEKQLQFRGVYLANREDYKKKMETFFEENPEAKPSKRIAKYVYVECGVPKIMHCDIGKELIGLGRQLSQVRKA